MSDNEAPERYRGNIRNPLVKQAATYQNRVRVESSDAKVEISRLIREMQMCEAEVLLLTFLIGQTSEPDEARRAGALVELERLFNGEPDSILPAQERFQRGEPGPHPAIDILQTLKDLVDTGDLHELEIMNRIDLALKYLE